MNISLCNELFNAAVPVQELAHRCNEIGIGGLELAPETVFASGGRPSNRELVRLRRVFRDAGIRFCGFHWLLRHDPSLRLITDSSPSMSPAWQTILRLAAAAAEIGGGVLVLGSGEQRRHPVTMTAEEAMRAFREGARFIAERVGSTVTLGIEPLPSHRTNLLTTFDDVLRLVETIALDTLGVVFDLRSAGHEHPPVWDHLAHPSNSICHVHVQHNDGTLPRPSSPGLMTTLSSLRKRSYPGWISLEPFSIGSDVERALKRVHRIAAWMHTNATPR